MRSVPLPPRGRTMIQYTIADRTIVLSRPPENKLRGVDFSYQPLFRSLSLRHISTIVSCILTERSVVFASASLALLAPVIEGLLSLIFPFTWQGVYIPVLPNRMWDIILSPVPFIVGCDIAARMGAAATSATTKPHRTKPKPLPSPPRGALLSSPPPDSCAATGLLCKGTLPTPSIASPPPLLKPLPPYMLVFWC